MGAQQSLQRNDKIEYSKQFINDIVASYIQTRYLHRYDKFNR